MTKQVYAPATEANEQVRRANAYPKLVEALRELQATLGADFLDCPLGKARTFLRELGEPS